MPTINTTTSPPQPAETKPCPGCKRQVVPYAFNFVTSSGQRYRDSLCRCGNCGRLWKAREVWQRQQVATRE